MRSLRRRPVVVGALAAGVVVGSVAVSAAALAGHRSPRVVAARASSTTTEAPLSTAIVTTTAPPPPTTTTTRPAPPPTSTTPPTTQAPATTVATVAKLQISPSTADFPSTPPPYWPMPIVHVTVTNTGTATISSLVVHPVGVYSVPSNSCATLAPGQSCSADVQFCPSSPGDYVNTLIVTGENAATGTPLQDTISLEGTAT